MAVGEQHPLLSELPNQADHGAKHSAAVQEAPPNLSVSLDLQVQAYVFPRGSVAKKADKLAPGNALILSEEQTADLVEMRGIALSRPPHTLVVFKISTMSGREGLIELDGGQFQLRVSVIPLFQSGVTQLTVEASLTGDEFGKADELGKKQKPRRFARAVDKIKPSDVMALSFDEGAEDVLLLVRSTKP